MIFSMSFDKGKISLNCSVTIPFNNNSLKINLAMLQNNDEKNEIAKAKARP